MTMNSRNIALYGGGGVLALLVIWAFAITGSPQTQRKLGDDRDTAGNMECLACYAVNYACENKQHNYPQTKEVLLEHISKNPYCSQDNLDCYGYDNYYHRRDEEMDFSALKYEYSSAKGITICGTFNFDEKEQKRMEESRSLPPELRDYKKGEQCITFQPRKCRKEQIGYAD